MKYIYYFYILFFLFFWTRCSYPEMDINLQLKLKVISISYSSVEAQASYNQEFAQEITEKGFCWRKKNSDSSTSDKLSILKNNKLIISGNNFSGNINNLEIDSEYGSEYEICSYIILKSGYTVYSNVCLIQTQSIFYVLPEIKTNPTATNITYSSATVGGEITEDKNYPVEERGVCYSLSSYPEIDDSFKIICGKGKGSFSTTISGLKSSTRYYVRAYGTNKFGTGYGETISFYTALNPLIIITVSAWNITSSSAIIGGSIINTGGNTVTEKGVVWGFDDSLTTNAKKKVIESGSDAFSTTITGLQPGAKYYYRAYAINKYGTVYGDVRTFYAL